MILHKKMKNKKISNKKIKSKFFILIQLQIDRNNYNKNIYNTINNMIMYKYIELFKKYVRKSLNNKAIIINSYLSLSFWKFCRLYYKKRVKKNIIEVANKYYKHKSIKKLFSKWRSSIEKFHKKRMDLQRAKKFHVLRRESIALNLLSSIAI
jgi:hypothetical protein